jgi:hypothetical protein
MRDLIHELKAVPFIPAVSPADNTPIVSAIIDLQGFDSIAFYILTGSLADADATFTTLLEEGDDPALADHAAVADIDMLSDVRGAAPEASASFTFAADNSVFRLGYIGNKRYVRMTITPGANTGLAFIAALAVKGDPASMPT